nr:MAG TPA: hypothetical protein [Caudoviricetes sp.]
MMITFYMIFNLVSSVLYDLFSLFLKKCYFFYFI